VLGPAKNIIEKVEIELIDKNKEDEPDSGRISEFNSTTKFKRLRTSLQNVSATDLLKHFDSKSRSKKNLFGNTVLFKKIEKIAVRDNILLSKENIEKLKNNQVHNLEKIDPD
jgi:hypothetical protein